MNLRKDYNPDFSTFLSLPSILRVEEAIGSVFNDHVYVGGAIVGFYIDDQGGAEIRPTVDVDVIVEVASEIARIQLDEKLRDAGLENDIHGPICRWRLGSTVVDIMPTDPAILGFSNRWYGQIMEDAVMVKVDETELRIPNVCSFLATKIEAFWGRGKDDFVMSSDFEDIIRVLDGCSFLIDESTRAPREIRSFVSETFRYWNSIQNFRDGINTHLEGYGSGYRGRLVRERIAELINLSLD